MAGNRTICKCMGVDYLSIRIAMVNHTARTVEEIQQITAAGTGCGGCISEIEEILASVCGCTGTSLKEVVDAVNAGASTVETVGEQTKAGTDCGRCQVLIENVIQNKTVSFSPAYAEDYFATKKVLINGLFRPGMNALLGGLVVPYKSPL